MVRNIGLIVIAALAGFAGVYGYSQAGGAPSMLTASSTCNIKGNVSLNTGERIYHVPGQHYYAATIITPEKGERWFCSEAEARAAGWRAASF